MSEIRVQKLIAQYGKSSRRMAERLIRAGLVTVNGKPAVLGQKANLETDAIKVEGKLLYHRGQSHKKIYYVFNKPQGVIAMVNKDPEGRPTLSDWLKGFQHRLFPVGRMDYNGTGMLLMTNDGDFAAAIQKSRQLPRRYRVKVKGHPKAEDLESLRKGTRLEGRIIRPAFVKVFQQLTSKTLIDVLFVGMGTLDVKSLFMRKGFLVEKITLTGIGQLRLGKLPPGGFKELKESQIQALLKQPELGIPKVLKENQEL